MRRRTRITFSPRKTCRWPIRPRQDGQCLPSPGTQIETTARPTSHPLGGLLSGKLENCKCREDGERLAGAHDGAVTVETARGSLRGSIIELACGPAIRLWGVHPREQKAGTQTDICTPRQAKAFLTRAKTWKQNQRPPID